MADMMLKKDKINEHEVDLIEEHLGVRYFRNHEGHMVFREVNKGIIEAKRELYDNKVDVKV